MAPLNEKIDVNVNTDICISTKKHSSQKRIRRLLNRQENKICLDCSRPDPRWATLITAPSPSFKSYDAEFTLGGFCCLECSGAHRTLGTHLAFVRSVDLDSLKEEEIRTLERTGNSVVNSVFEGRLFSTEVGGDGISISFTKEIRPDASSDQKTREHFIKNKYGKKMYLDILALNRFHRSLSIPSPPDENSILSPVSSNEHPASPLQLQIYTSSPRTLAMLEKYMNPKPKRKKLATRIRAALTFGRCTELIAAESKSSPMIDMPRSLKVLETRSVEDEAEENEYVGAYSDSECDTSTSQRRRALREMSDLFDFDFDDCSVSSTQSTMSANKRRRWMARRKKFSNKKKKAEKKPKKSPSRRKLSSIEDTPVMEAGESSIDECKENVGDLTNTIAPLTATYKLPKLEEEEESYHYDNVEQVYEEKVEEAEEEREEKEENNIRAEEINAATSWSRSVDKLLFRRFSRRQEREERVLQPVE